MGQKCANVIIHSNFFVTFNVIFFRLQSPLTTTSTMLQNEKKNLIKKKSSIELTKATKNVRILKRLA